MKMSTLFATSIFVLPLVGCGGSSGGGEPAAKEVHDSYIYSFNKDEIQSWLDVELKAPLDANSAINKSQIVATFDINNSGSFDEGDIKIIAGNASNFGSLMNSWGTGTEVFVETMQGGETYRARKGSGIIIGGGVNNIFVNNIGGAWFYTKTVDNVLTDRTVGIRINKDIAAGSNSQNLNALVNQLAKITASTPVNVVLTSGLQSPSVDYVPGQNIFSQQVNAMIEDPAADFTGTESWVDITAVTFGHKTAG